MTVLSIRFLLALILLLSSACIVHTLLNPVPEELRKFSLKSTVENHLITQQTSIPTSSSAPQQSSSHHPRVGGDYASEEFKRGLPRVHYNLTDDDNFFRGLISLTKAGSSGVKQAVRILSRLEEEDYNDDDDDAPSNFTSRYYNLAIELCGKLGKLDSAELLFRRMGAKATRGSYSALMHACIRCEKLQRAVNLLDEMENSIDEDIHPITSDYNLLLFAYGRNRAATQAEELLKRMVDRCMRKEKELGYQDSWDFAPDLHSYNLLLEAHAKSNKPNAGERAMEVLRELNNQYDAGDCSFRPNGRTYASVMQAVLRSDDSNNKALSVVRDLFEESKARGIEHDAYLQSLVVSAYASYNDPSMAIQAESFLDEIESEGNADLIVHNTVLKAWKNSNSPDAVERAEAILRRMEKRQCVDTISYTTMVGALAKKGDEASALQAHEILAKMQESNAKGNSAVKPNVQTFNNVLHAWVRCSQYSRAEQVLGQMEMLLREGQADCAPSVVSYSTVMSGWAKSGAPDALQRTEAVFQRMVAMYESGHEAAEPNLFSYVILINAFGRYQDPSAAPRAEDKLFEMYRKYKSSGNNKDLKPNIQLITTVIDCWRKSGRPDAGERAEALLDWALARYMEDHDENIRPNEFTFATAISAWGRSRKLGKAVRARSILTKMIDLYESGKLITCPNTYCFTAVLNCCAYCENDVVEKREALRIAIATYKDLVASKYGSPNEVTFSSLLTALRNILPEGKERTSAVQSIFISAAKDGHVDDLVFRRVQSSLTKEELREFFSSTYSLPKDRTVSLEQLPNEWRRNVASQPRP